jgi:hypothetical protein
MVFAATEIGTPEGDKVTKDIGPAGGTLSSPDGRLTLTVPQGALTETVSFSMQPVTNKAGNGLGLAYRLEPDGKTFTTPLQISVRYDEKDLEGTIPEALSLAYQDQQGAWHELKSEKLDQKAKTLTVTTTHFTDVAFLARLRMSPLKATLHVGESQSFRLVSCEELGFFDKIRGVDPRDKCISAPKGSINRWELKGAGTLTDNGEGVIYTAPDKKPADNKAYIDHTIEFDLREPATGRMSKIKETFRAVVTIIGYGFRATGGTADVKYSGVICSLEKEFTVQGTYPSVTIPFKFVPTSATGGMAGYNATFGKVNLSGNGSYAIEGSDTDSPKIIWHVNMSMTVPGASRSQSGAAPIQLVPLETDECN